MLSFGKKVNTTVFNFRCVLVQWWCPASKLSLSWLRWPALRNEIAAKFKPFWPAAHSSIPFTRSNRRKVLWLNLWLKEYRKQWNRINDRGKKSMGAVMAKNHVSRWDQHSKLPFQEGNFAFLSYVMIRLESQCHTTRPSRWDSNICKYETFRTPWHSGFFDAFHPELTSEACFLNYYL